MSEIVVQRLVIVAAIGLLWVMASCTFGIDVDANFSSVRLGDSCAGIVDKSSTLGTLGEAKKVLNSSDWQPCTDVDLSRGYTNERLWLRFDFNNRTTTRISLYLNTFPSWTNQLDTFFFEGDNLISSQPFGTHIGFHDRPIPSPNFIIPVLLEPKQEQTVLIYVASADSLLIGGDILSNKKMLDSVATLNFLNGLIIGGLVLLSFYNLFIFFSLRDYDYLYYFLYGCSMIVVLSVTYGFGYQIFWPNSTQFNNFAEVSAGPFSAIFVSLFVRKFLNLDRVSKVMDTVLKFVMYSSLAVFFLSMFPMFMDKASIWSGVLSIILGPIVLISGIVALKKGEVSARFFLFSWVFSLISVVFLGLVLTGFFEFELRLYYSFGFCILLEMTLLSFALANKIQYLQAEKSNADLAMLKAEIEFSRGLAEAAAQLEYKVSVRTSSLAKEKRRAELLARTDPLTGLNNRRAFFEFGERFFDEVTQGQAFETLSVVMIDIDFFKQVNDDYGHSVGDIVITAVSLSLLPFFSIDSVVGRIGGEEFGVVLKGVSGQKSLEQSELARQHIADMNIPIKDQQTVKVSISLGIAEYRLADKSIDEILARADIALYQAKKTGRNKTVLLSL